MEETKVRLFQLKERQIVLGYLTKKEKIEIESLEAITKREEAINDSSR